MNAVPRIWVDFMKVVGPHRLALTCLGTQQSIAEANLELREGMRAVLYEDDVRLDGQPDELEADAIIRYDRVNGIWVADYDESTLRYASGHPYPGTKNETGSDM